MTFERERFDPEAFAVERRGLHADPAPIADVDFEFPVGVEIAQFHVGDAAVRALERVFGIVRHEFPVLIEYVAALLPGQESDDAAFAVGAGGGAEPADVFVFGQIQLVHCDQPAVEPHFSHGVPILDHQQPRGTILSADHQDVAGRFHLRTFPEGRELEGGRLAPRGYFGLGNGNLRLSRRGRRPASGRLGRGRRRFLRILF